MPGDPLYLQTSSAFVLMAFDNSRRVPVILIQAVENWERDNFSRSFLFSL